MRTVVFETNDAVFYFELSNAIGYLNYYSVKHNVRQATDLLETISSSSSDVINIESDYFGYVVLNLIKDGKGSVFCKPCQKTYLAGQLHSMPVGSGKSPFLVNLKEKGGIIKRFFSKKKRIMCMRGGEAYDCLNGHRLISMITWIS